MAKVAILAREMVRTYALPIWGKEGKKDECDSELFMTINYILKNGGPKQTKGGTGLKYTCNN